MVALSVLDQVPIFCGDTPAKAVSESIMLAQTVEALGYRRFWVAEHHGGALTCPSPEILVAAIAANTRRILVGPGGVMLPHYSPLKVAETFRLLHALFPGRIELGIGRGPGASIQFCRALRSSIPMYQDSLYATEIADLVGFLTEGSRHQDLQVMPDGPGAPDIWLLGAGPSGVKIAASLGLSFCFAQFIHTAPHPQVMEVYRQTFSASLALAQPRASLAVRVLCAETEEKAQELASSFWLVYLRTQNGEDKLSVPGKPPRVPSFEEAHRQISNEQDQAIIHENQLLQITGDPLQVKARLLELATLYQVDELVITTICSDLAARLRSYQLLAEAFALPAGWGH